MFCFFFFLIRIMGPPALQQAVLMHENLSNSNRPIYNYSMRGVITCFTGIRKKDELVCIEFNYK